MIRTATFVDPALGALNLAALEWRCSLPAVVPGLHVANMPTDRTPSVVLGGKLHIIAAARSEWNISDFEPTNPEAGEYMVRHRLRSGRAYFRIAEAIVPAGAHAECRALEMAERCRPATGHSQIRHVAGGGLSLPHGVRLDGLGRPKRAVTVDGVVVNSLIDSAVVTGQPWLALGGFLAENPGTPIAALPTLARLALQLSGRDWVLDLQGASIVVSIRSHQETFLCNA
ncbi:hypothetical protein [Prosthecomicrobium hirschii]|uniref:hypothetical protein n=1 Tax=Prosthecodimorpha hirschii TaxID=665126 RepID=UPI0022212AF6|nr:hypothetical protein [Prosthecomicrobium hirschii]MCW1838764.1 hypothetical protein [Prosthecomicrobium hirschii]